MAGVSPKTLRHYERLRLIAPRRNAAGYRVYAEGELHRIRDVLALKALGLSLSEIGDLLARRRPPLDVLRGQRETLERKRRSLDRALEVIREVERFEAGRPAADRVLPALIAEASWSRAEQQRDEAAPPAARAPDRAGASRIALAHETLRAIDDGRDLDGLRARWRDMLSREAAAHPEIAEERAKACAGRRHWPRGMREWAASLYEMDLDSFERLARFIDALSETRSA